MEEVRVLDHHEAMANKNEHSLVGVTHAVLQLCAEVRGLREHLEKLERNRIAAIHARSMMGPY